MLQIRQGDVLLTPVARLPRRAVIAETPGIVIEGERTGHAHRLLGLVALLGAARYVRGGAPLTHEEHATVTTEPVWYLVTEQREWVGRSSRRYD